MFSSGGALPVFIRETRRTVRTGDDALKFDVAEPPNWSYAPGDTIIGNLVRKEGIFSPDATVKVGLVGRAVTEIIEPGNSRTTRQHTGACSYLGLEQDVIFKGPLNFHEVNAELLSWSFSDKIPTEQGGSHSRGLSEEVSFVRWTKVTRLGVSCRGRSHRSATTASAVTRRPLSSTISALS